MQTNVNALMDGELGSWLDKQRSILIDAKSASYKRCLLAHAFLLPAIVYIYLDSDMELIKWLETGANKYWALILSLLIFSATWWVVSPVIRVERDIKFGINSAIARQLGLEYSPYASPSDELELSKIYGLVPYFDKGTFEDFWYGKIRGHAFRLYEAHLEVVNGDGKPRRGGTKFRGAIISIEFGRRFHSTTLLQRSGKHKKWFGLGGRKDNATFGGHQLNIVDQVHPCFDDVFEVWSDDQVEARVIVHPSYVEHLLALEKAFNGKAVRALFKDGKIVMAMESGDLFESGDIHASGGRKRVEEAAKQFETLATFSIAFNQNERGRMTRYTD